jgi:hypothetical protein
MGLTQWFVRALLVLAIVTVGCAGALEAYARKWNLALILVVLLAMTIYNVRLYLRRETQHAAAHPVLTGATQQRLGVFWGVIALSVVTVVWIVRF